MITLFNDSVEYHINETYQETPAETSQFSANYTL